MHRISELDDRAGADACNIDEAHDRRHTFSNLLHKSRSIYRYRMREAYIGSAPAHTIIVTDVPDAGAVAYDNA
ncbi:hypothetical protein D3C84_1015440 [compost metagenome]